MSSIVFYHHNYYATPISCSITTPSYIMRMLARKKRFLSSPLLASLDRAPAVLDKFYSCDISFSIRRIPAMLSSSKARGGLAIGQGILGHSQEVKEDFRTRSSGQGAELAGQGS